MVDNPFFFFINNFVSLIASLPFFASVRPDVVIISIPPADQFLSIFLISKIMKTKLIVDYRDEFEDYLILHKRRWRSSYFFLKKLLSCFYRHSYLLTPVTPTVAEGLRQRGIFNLQIVYDGVDTGEFKPFDKNEARKFFEIPLDTFVMVYLGNVYTPYRLDIVVDALKILKNNRKEGNCLLLIAGAGNIEKLLRYANVLDVERMIRFEGQIDEVGRIIKLLSAADVGIIPYDDNPLWKKTLSTKLFEYTACGLPIIATVPYGSILAQYIKKYSLGLAVPALDSECLAKSIEEMRHMLKTGSSIGLNSIAFAKRYDKQEIAEEFLTCILRE